MRTSFVCNAANGTYLSPMYENVANLDSFTANAITFEFYNDDALMQPSSGVTGSILLNGKMSRNSAWQGIPNSLVATPIDAANPLSVLFSGIVYQLQVIPNNITNANYIKVILDMEKAS